MATKSNTQVRSQGQKQQSNSKEAKEKGRYQTALLKTAVGNFEGLGNLMRGARKDDLHLALWAMETMRAQREGGEVKYPYKFMKMLSEMGLAAVQEYLEKQEAPKPILDLMDDLVVLNAWMGTAKGAAKPKDADAPIVESMVRNVRAANAGQSAH